MLWRAPVRMDFLSEVHSVENKLKAIFFRFRAFSKSGENFSIKPPDKSTPSHNKFAMPPATQESTNMTAVYAARLARHEPYYRKHNESRASTSVSKRSASNVYKRSDPDPYPTPGVKDKRSASNVYKRPDTDPDPTSGVNDKRSDNSLFDMSERRNDEAYASVLSKVLYFCW